MFLLQTNQSDKPQLDLHCLQNSITFFDTFKVLRLYFCIIPKIMLLLWIDQVKTNKDIKCLTMGQTDYRNNSMYWDTKK